VTSQKKLSTHAETLIELCNFLSHRSTQTHRQTRCESEGNDWPGGLCWSCWTCREPNSVRPSNLRRLWFHLVARRAAAALMAKWRQTLPERESSGCCASFQHSPQSFILVIRSLRSRRRPTRKKKKTLPLCRYFPFRYRFIARVADSRSAMFRTSFSAPSFVCRTAPLRLLMHTAASGTATRCDNVNRSLLSAAAAAAESCVLRTSKSQTPRRSANLIVRFR